MSKKITINNLFFNIDSIEGKVVQFSSKDHIHTENNWSVLANSNITTTSTSTTAQLWILSDDNIERRYFIPGDPAIRAGHVVEILFLVDAEKSMQQIAGIRNKTTERFFLFPWGEIRKGVPRIAKQPWGCLAAILFPTLPILLGIALGWGTFFASGLLAFIALVTNFYLTYKENVRIYLKIKEALN